MDHSGRKKAGGVIIKNEPGQKMNNVDNIKKRYQPLTKLNKK